MADQGKKNEGESSKSDKSEDYDPRLDFFSDKFDPLLALNTPNLKVPDETAKKYDNLAILEAALKNENDPQQGQRTSKKTQTVEVEVKRKWLPHQCELFVCYSSQYIRNLHFHKVRLCTAVYPPGLPIYIYNRTGIRNSSNN